MRTSSAAVLLALAMGVAGCVVTPANPYPPPPPNQAEMVPRAVPAVPPGSPPGTAMVWRPGHYRWNGAAYVWVPGRYVMRSTAASRWVPGHWAYRGGGWVWVGGHWT